MSSRPGKSSEQGTTISPAGRHARIAFSLDLLHLHLAVGTGYDDLVAVRSEALFDGRDDGGEKRIVEIRNKDGDDLGLSRANMEASGSAR